jgi:kynurenine formamidase
MALPQEFHDLAKRVNNWGRWGDEDQIGTLNLITPDVVRKGAACVKAGKRFSLAIPLSLDGPQLGAVPGRINPLRTMTAINVPYTGDPADFCYSDDVVVMGLQAGTHWDALSHVSYEGKLYNGFPAASITTFGAAMCGIDKVRTLVGHGVLLDVARVKKVDRVPGGTPITPEDLDAAEELARVKVRPGDVVLIRSGEMTLLKNGDREAYGAFGVDRTGLGMAAVEWLHDRDVAAAATDNLSFEVWPPERPDALLPVHLLDLVDMGMTQGQNFDLEDLAADCADDGVYELFLSASPEPFVMGVGAPTNPVAIK